MQKKSGKHVMNLKRMIAALLSVVMVFSYTPLSVRAADLLPEDESIVAASTENAEDIIPEEGESNEDAGEIGTPEEPGNPEEGEPSGQEDADDEDSDGEGSDDETIDPAEGEETLEAEDALEEEVVEEAEEELVKDTSAGKFTARIYAAEDSLQDCSNLNVEIRFYNELNAESFASHEVYAIHPGEVTYEDDPDGQHRYENGTPEGGVVIPEGTVEVGIAINTWSDTAKIDVENGFSFSYLESASVSVDDFISAATTSAGFRFEFTNEGSFDLVLPFVPNESAIPNDNGGTYRVTVDESGELDPHPEVGVQFSTEDGATKYSVSNSMENWVDFPKGSGDSLPTSFTVSLDATGVKFLQNARILVKRNGEYTPEEYDMFDILRNDGEHKYTFPADASTDDPDGDVVEFNPEYSYEIEVTFSNTRSVCWSYKEKDRNTDYFVEHCQINLWEEDPNNAGTWIARNIYDEQDSSDTSGKFANYQLTIGETYYFKLVPDYGYQIAGLNINGYTIAPQDATGVFKFVMSDSNFHISGVVYEVGNIANITSESVGYTTINGSDVGSLDMADLMDPDMGGSTMVSITDTDTSNTYTTVNAVKDLVPECTLDISVNQAVDKGTAVEGVEQYWTKPIDLTGNHAEFELVYDGVEGATYTVLREHEGEDPEIIAATYDGRKLKFTTDKCSKFTVLRNALDEELDPKDLTFDLKDVVFDDDTTYALIPKKGLAQVGSTTNYTYTGKGNIQIEVKDKKDLTQSLNKEDISGTDKDFINRLGLLARTAENEEDPLFFFTEDDGGAIITIPAISDDDRHPHPIRELLERATKAIPSTAPVGTKPTVTPAFEWRHDVPHRLVRLNNTEEVEYNTPDPDPYWEWALDDEGHTKNYGYITGEDYIYVEAHGINNAAITSLTYRVIDCYPEEKDDGEVVAWRYEEAYPMGTAKLVDEESGIYRIPIPKPYDYIFWERLGVEISAKTQPMTTVTVDFGEDTSKYIHFDLEGGDFTSIFDVTARVGASLYDVSLDRTRDDKNVYRTSVPKGSTVAITVTPGEGTYNKVTGAMINDASKNNGKVVAPSKTGEFTLDTKGKDAVSLSAKVAAVNKLVILEPEENEEYVPYKGKYTLPYDKVFKAYVTNGTIVAGYHNVKLVIAEDPIFKNGNNAIAQKAGEITIDSGVLTTSGEFLNLAGNSMTLKADVGGTIFTALIAFTKPIDAITIAAEKDGVITLPYDTDAEIKITLPKGSDPEDLTVVTRGKEEDEYPLDVGFYEDGILHISNYDVYANYKPDEPNNAATIDFYVRGNATPIHSCEIRFTNPIKGKKPTIKANASLTDHHSLGLSLSLPKGLKASTNMYFKVEAKGTSEDAATYENGEGDVIYEKNPVYYIDASTKTYAMTVVPYETDCEMGWPVEYELEATLVYAHYEQGENPSKWIEKGSSDKKSDKINITTKGLKYETKLTLTKKLPKVVYNGMQSVTVAVPKWSAGTTVRSLDRVALLNSYGNEIAYYDRWDNNRSDRGASIWFSEDGTILIDTCQSHYNDETGDYDKEYLEPGKYTVVATAIGGPGVFPQASVTFDVKQRIAGLDITAPTSVLKPYNKAVSFKAGVTYFGDFDMKPAKKKVEWEVIKGRDDEGYDIDLEDTHLAGMVSIKNGKVTIAKGLKLSANPSDNTFMIKVWATDFSENSFVEAYSEPIEITAEALVPTKMYFRWYNEEEKIYHYSDITEENIKKKMKFPTSSINYAQVQVLDQYGRDMDVDINTSKITYDKASNELRVTKPAKMKVTAKSKDGGKKSKTLAFTTIYTNGDYDLNVSIYDASYEQGWDRTEPILSKEDSMTDNKTAINTYSGNSYIYFNVGGVWKERDGEDNLTGNWDFGNNALISHKLTIKGGKVVKTTYGEYEHYATYKILPSEKETVVTVKDNTKDSRYPDRKKGTTYTYKIINSGISNTKAIKITADKKSIYNRLWAPVEWFVDKRKVPNTVNYKLKKVPTAAEGKKLVVRLTMNEANGSRRNLARFMGLIPMDSDELNAEGVYMPISSDGKFTVDFFRETEADDHNHYYEFWETPVGTYSFYATIGQADNEAGEGFTPLAKMSTVKIKLAKVPTATGSFKKTAITVDPETGTDVEIASVKNGFGVKLDVWNEKEFDSDPDEFRSHAYYTLSTNTKGNVNRFMDLFGFENPMRTTGGQTKVGRYILGDVEDENPVLHANEVFGQFPIDVAPGKIAEIRGWGDLYALKNGSYKDDGGDPVGTEKQQKSAYTKWAKANLTGYIGYDVVDYGGNSRTVYQKVTVNIDNVLEAYKPEP
ncbi:MAG: hypothetical protein K6G10_01900 [Butyrivibrio sp.]|nr:hypothetical protein [Butyrivibrio sp.]